MIPLGTVNEKTSEVTEENTAKTWGSGTLPVYATPAMVLLIEETAAESAEAGLQEGETTVGTLLDIKHTSASPVGMGVRCRTELVEVDRARMRFKVEVFDSKGEIGTGFHERFVVRSEKFMARAQSKLE
ncbi:MAG: thioesterase family protein [Candidatus Methanomethylophilaceae archaeon]|jgi:predicted thioesterase